MTHAVEDAACVRFHRKPPHDIELFTDLGGNCRSNNVGCDEPMGGAEHCSEGNDAEHGGRCAGAQRKGEKKARTKKCEAKYGGTQMLKR